MSRVGFSNDCVGDYCDCYDCYGDDDDCGSYDGVGDYCDSDGDVW